MHSPRIVIYKSSAGSGKTYSLVLEYLKIVILNPQAYRNILAITFTNKATEEMKERIIKALEFLIHTPEKKLAKDHMYQTLQQWLQEHGTKTQKLDIKTQASKILYYVLSDYSSFSVSTIESFFQKVLRAFARELEVPLGYDIEMEQSRVLDTLISTMMLDVGQAESLTQLLQAFLLSNLDEEKSWQLEGQIKQVGEQIFKERFQRLTQQYPEAQADLASLLSFISALRKQARIFEQFMAKQAEQALSIIEAHELAPTDFKYGKSGVVAYFINIHTKRAYEPGARARKCDADPGLKHWAKAKSPLEPQIERAVDAGLQRLLHTLIGYYEAHFFQYNTIRTILADIYSFGLLSDLQEKLEAYRQEHKLLLISDTSFLLSNIIQGDDTPFIFEKVGTRYRYFLLDEFQDTSDMQWKNLFPLVLEAISHEHPRLAVGIMGDVKQSIYRWRNGNMRLLLDGVESQVYQESGQIPLIKTLSSNWRTAAEIVQFNNQFFIEAAKVLDQALEAEHSLFAEAYNEVSQKAQRTKHKGLVQLQRFPEKDTDKNGEEIKWKSSAKQSTLEQILQLRTEGFRLSDITLLVRRNSEGVEMAEFLQKQGIKVLSSESLRIYKHPGVRLLESLLHYLIDGTDAIAEACVKYYLQLRLEQGHIDHALFAHQRLEDIFTPFTQSIAQLKRLPIFECLAQIQALSPGLWPENAYVSSFLDLVLNYSNKYDGSIAGFLQWWTEMRSSQNIASSPDQDAVEIMTIHKAKGLEFPVVIMPFADWELSPNRRDILWVRTGAVPEYEDFPFLPVRPTKNLANTHFAEAYAQEQQLSYLDNLNLLYVAFTRPKYRLYLYMPSPKSTKQKDFTRISQLITYILLGETLELAYDEGKDSWSYGTLAPPPTIQAVVKEAREPISSYPRISLSSALRIRFNANRYVKQDIREKERRIQVGELIHAALAFIQTAADIPQAVEQLYLAGQIPQALKADLEVQLSEIVNHLAAFHWFSSDWQIKNEAEIITRSGELLRPDRVMINGEQAIVVDYKTGKFHGSYAAQIRKYKHALAEMGYAKVKGYVYYVALGQVDEV